MCPFALPFFPLRQVKRATVSSMAIPKSRRHHPTKAFGSFALKKMPPMPVTRARRVRATMPGGEQSGYEEWLNRTPFSIWVPRKVLR